MIPKVVIVNYILLQKWYVEQSMNYGDALHYAQLIVDSQKAVIL